MKTDLIGKKIWVIGWSTSGENQEESPSVDIEIRQNASQAKARLLTVLREQQNSNQDDVSQEVKRWNEEDDLFVDDEAGTIYYIVGRVIGGKNFGY